VNKKTVLIDLDGVLNEYQGIYDENIIPPLKTGAQDFLEKLSSEFIVKIFTTRPYKKVYEWVIHYNIEKYISGITDKKEPAYLIIDDRCIIFNGNYQETIEKINNFKVWYK
jgi:hypothetical protein